MSSLYETRLQRMRAYLERSKIDVALIVSPVTIFYYTGFYTDPHERFMALVINMRAGSETLLVPELDGDAADERSCVRDIIAISDTAQPFTLLRARLDGQIGTIGVEKRAIKLDWYERLTAIYPGVSATDIEAFVQSERMVKSDSDIQNVREAVSIAEQALQGAVGHIREGMSELELTAELEFQIRRCGGEKPAFESIVLAGKGSALPHGKPSGYRMSRGDFVLIDMGVYYGGYCSDMTRTFLLGEGSDEQTAMYDAVLAANLSAIEAAKSAKALGEIDRAGRRAIEERGYGRYFTHRIGHGFGMEIHELPSIHGENEEPVTPGCLFTIEPGVYVPAIGGVRIEDDIYVREDRTIEVLTGYSKKLLVL